MFSAFLPHLYIRRLDPEGDSHVFTLDALYADIDFIVTSVESTGGLGGWASRGRI